MKKIRIIFSFFILILSSCSLKNDYQVPEVTIPSTWKNATNELVTSDLPLENWWEIFEDETLNCLEQTALENNLDLKIALERIKQARSIAGKEKAALLPQITLNPGYERSSSLVQFPDFSQKKGKNKQTKESNFRFKQTRYSLPVDVSYQLDLFGLYKGQYQAAIFSKEAEEANYQIALLTLTTDLASSYFQLRTLETEITYLENTKKIRKAAEEITQARFKAGLVNYVDVTRASLELNNANARLYNTIRLKNRQENQIATLMGIPSSHFQLKACPLKKAPPEIPVNLPATILMKRPDIAKAERQLAAEHALIGVAYASFLPTINLTTLFGFISPDFRHFLSWVSNFYQYGVNTSQSLFDGGFDVANLATAKARFSSASLSYQKQVLLAFQEVENALSDLELEKLQYESLEKARQDAKNTIELSNNRYSKGLVNYLEVVDTERVELELSVTAIQLLGERYLATIQLIKAVGGSFASYE